MRRAIYVLFPLMLTGCGLPPAISVASYAIDGISYVSTGKGLSDHALSAVAEKDCAMWRVLEEKPICRDYRKGEQSILVTLAENSVPTYPGDESGEPGAVDALGMQSAPQRVAAGSTLFAGRRPSGLRVASSDDMIVTPDTAGWSPVLTARDAERRATPAPGGTRPAQIRTAHTVLVVGSYRRRGNARRVANSWRKFRPVVVATKLRGQIYFRVVTGPFSGATLAEQRTALVAAGLQRVWAANLCLPGQPTPGCIALPAGTSGTL